MNDILAEYDENKNNYDAYSKSLESLLDNLLSCNKIKVHSINSRIKERVSLENKIESKGIYSHINEITDIIGIRIITHYADEVDAVAEMIKNEFIIDLENSIDKRETHEPDRFGYLSLHYIISLRDERSKLAEYKRFGKIKAELQIRSILQHTWAEIEHDIGYKSEVGIPRKIKRQFSRLAGLLEIGDSEFINIRNSLGAYEEKIKNDMNNNSGTIQIDRVSLKEYCDSSITLSELANQVAVENNIEVSKKSGKNLEFALNNLIYVNITTINHLDDEIKRKRSDILKKCTVVAERRKLKQVKYPLPRDILIIYLVQSLVVEKGGKDAVKEYVSIFKRGSRPNSDFVKELLATFS